jgi:hypothetical protein
MRPRTFVAQGYRAEVDHPPQCLSAVGGHGTENEKLLDYGKTFWRPELLDCLYSPEASSETTGNCCITSLSSS